LHRPKSCGAPWIPSTIACTLTRTSPRVERIRVERAERVITIDVERARFLGASRGAFSAPIDSTPSISVETSTSAPTLPGLARSTSTSTSSRIRVAVSVRNRVAPAPTGSKTTGTPCLFDPVLQRASPRSGAPTRYQC
jgi:hypothetical protein